MRTLSALTVTGFIALAAGTLTLGGCALSDPKEDPVQIRLNDLDTRLTNVQRVIDNQSLVQLSQRIDTLETQVRQLRGSSEEQQNASESQRKQQRDLYADLNQRLTALEQQVKSGAASGAGAGGDLAAGGNPGAGAGSAGSAIGAGGGAGGAAASDDQAAYQHAFNTLKGGDTAGGINEFTSFMQNYPSSALLDNAQYWLGEAYYVNRDFDHAATAFRAVGQKWPNSRKAPDALLKLGYTQIEQKRYGEARLTLASVSRQFPGSDAAKLAADKLQKMSADPH